MAPAQAFQALTDALAARERAVTHEGAVRVAINALRDANAASSALSKDEFDTTRN